MRAPRFPLKLPVRYRLAGDPRWCQGRTENISYSGVLFRAEELINVNTPIELRVALSADTRERPHPEVFCHARIVRAVPPTPCRPRTRTRGRPWPSASSSTSSCLRRSERPERAEPRLQADHEDQRGCPGLLVRCPVAAGLHAGTPSASP